MAHTHSPAVLLLQDGTVARGYAFGAPGTTSGEICFNTGMTGYQEVFTDPSYYGQVVVMNAVHVGNYGTMHQEEESDGVKIRGVISKNLNANFSREKATGSLQEYFKKNNIVAIHGVDTRALVAHIRAKGAMNCIISSEIFDIETLQRRLKDTPGMSGLELASAVSTAAAYECGDANAGIKIAVMDFGIKQNILHCMVSRGAFVKVFPAKTKPEEIRAFAADGYFISNGPGDPAAMGYAIDTIKELLKENKPLFGICLGHQLLALANGITTYKMHHGHRGLNHPVKNLITGGAEITTQNHGFGVDAESVRNSGAVEITHLNLNDGSVEGIRMKDKPAFSVQYHPEAAPGPHDSRYLFDEFIALMKKAKK